MNEIIRHIENLLKENDCVIIPNLGGFVAYYTSATQRDDRDGQLFIPPTRTIGFNHLLKINDGLLTQAYMNTHGISFSKASERMENDILILKKILREQGKVVLGDIGELRYSLYETYTFFPSGEKMTVPAFYGFESFAMKTLADPGKKMVSLVVKEAKRQDTRHTSVYKNLINLAAIAASIILFFFLSAPIQNTEVRHENYARLLPEELFGQMEERSITTTPIKLTSSKIKEIKHFSKEKKNIMPGVVEEMKESPVTAEPNFQPAMKDHSETNNNNETKENASTVYTAMAKRYHIIVASVNTDETAQKLTDKLNKKGFTDARTLKGDGKIRVCIQSYISEKEAYEALEEFRKQDSYTDAWILKK